MFNIIAKYHYSNLQESKGFAIAQPMAKYGIWEMTVKTCGRAKLVCSSWYLAFSSGDPCKKIAEFEMLFRPMFERFVYAVSQIDLNTANPKFDSLFGTPVMQEYYEEERFKYALKNGKIGCGLICEETGNDVNRLLGDKWDKERLVSACESLFKDFYKKDSVIKVHNIDFHIVKIFENKFAKMTIGQLYTKIEEADQGCIKAYKDVVTVIKVHKLLPIESRELLQKGVGRMSMPASSFWGICFIVGLVLAIIVCPLIWVFCIISSEN